MKSEKSKIWQGFTLRSVATKGFTLIELLVVISIIGILAALTLTGFNAAQKNARDATKKSDLQQYRVALEAYASNNNGKYPVPGSTLYAGASSDSISDRIFSDPATDNPIVTEYLPALILVPGPTGASYFYAYRVNAAPAGTEYTLVTRLETGGFWQVCSDGRAGKINQEIWPGSPNMNDSTCDVSST